MKNKLLLVLLLLILVLPLASAVLGMLSLVLSFILTNKYYFIIPTLSFILIIFSIKIVRLIVNIRKKTLPAIMEISNLNQFRKKISPEEYRLRHELFNRMRFKALREALQNEFVKKAAMLFVIISLVAFLPVAKVMTGSAVSINPVKSPASLLYFILLLGLLVIINHNSIKKVILSIYEKITYKPGENRIRGMLGKEVYIENGNYLGKVREVYLENFKISSWLIKVNKDIRKKTGKKNILLSQNSVKSIRNIMIIDEKVIEYLDNYKLEDFGVENEAEKRS